MQYRHEVKYIISSGDAAAARASLSGVAQLDPHAREKGYYLVRSLYFDDPADTALRQKLDGVSERRKFRLRCYDGDLNTLVLECKMKRDDAGLKPREPLTAEEAETILRGETGWMIQSGRPLLVLLYAEMKSRQLAPKTMAEYRRIPFTYAPGNVRVTIDWDIRTGAPGEFLKPEGLTIPIREDVTLLEVKWDSYLPQAIREAAALKNRYPAAFSKYAACRAYR